MEKEIIRLKQAPRIYSGEFNIDINTEFGEYKDMNFNLNSDISFGKIENHKNLLSCILKETLTDSKELIKISVSIEGVFEIENCKRDEKELKKICVESLFPYVRQYINQVTAQAGIKPILFPIFDLYEEEEEV